MKSLSKRAEAIFRQLIAESDSCPVRSSSPWTATCISQNTPLSGDSLKGRMAMKKAVLFGIFVTLAGTLSAQEFPRFAFNAGAGFTRRSGARVAAWTSVGTFAAA